VAQIVKSVAFAPFRNDCKITTYGFAPTFQLEAESNHNLRFHRELRLADNTAQLVTDKHPTLTSREFSNPGRTLSNTLDAVTPVFYQ
jgi:hypothetical protein